MGLQPLKKSAGQGTPEYLILSALMVLVLIAVFNLAGLNIQNIYNKIEADASGDPAEIPGMPPHVSAAVRQPTVTETGRPGVLFSDNFEDPEFPRWAALETGLWKGRWNVRGGRAIGEPFSAMVVKNLDESNYTVTVRGLTLADTKNSYNGFGVIFRAGDEKNGDGYMFEYERKDTADPGLLFFSKWVMGNQVFPPIASAAPPPHINWHSPQDVRVQVLDSTFTAYINGQPVLTAQDDFYSTGTAGLSVNNGSTASIEDFHVELSK